MAPKFSQYTVYKPNGGDALVKSSRSTIYYFRDDEAFYAAIDIYLVKTTWVSGWSWENNTEAVQAYTYSYTTQLKVTRGAEVTNSVSVGAAFEGLSVSMGTSGKTFSSTETTTSRTTTLTANIPARTKVTHYQRMYEFRSSIHFVLDAWNEEWNAGSSGGCNIIRKECTVQIMSEDYLTTDSELDSAVVGSLTVATVPRENREESRRTRMRRNLTKRAKDALSKMGV